MAQQDGREQLAQNARWVVKLNGLYALPRWDISVSAVLNARDGFPFNPTVQTPNRAGGLGRANVLVEPASSRRLDDLYQVDFRVDKAVRVKGSKASLAMDVFNLFNRNTVLARVANFSSTTANNVTEVLAPRILRFGVRMTF